jgi:hypothetical protein
MAYNLNSRLDYVGTRLKPISNDPSGKCRIVRHGYSREIECSLAGVDVSERHPEYIITVDEYQGFIVDADEYHFGFEPTTPEVGDYIIRPDGLAYRVVAPSETVAPYEWTTSTRQRMRVHTVCIGRERDVKLSSC